jgi:cysteinyl-tRNA synthetase
LFFADLAKLNIEPPSVTPHATAYISQIIALIQNLLDKKAAYLAADGVYFRVSELKDYGQLGIKPPADQPVIEQDFALWKLWKADDGEVAWEAPFGKGRPGWHIECSAMIESVLGTTIDIHTGATDLIFPHHENEIAQSETAHGGAKLANYWLHGGFLNMGDEKMSKSLGNYITLQTLEENNISPLAYRYWLLQANYRTATNFTWEALEAAAQAEATAIFYESPERILKTLSYISNAFPTSQVVAARELTKMHEEFIRGTPYAVMEQLKGKPSIKGEFTILVSFKN